MGLPGQQRPAERFRATPRRLADKPTASLHGPAQTKAPPQEAGLSWSCCAINRACRISRGTASPTDFNAETPHRLHSAGETRVG